MSSTALRVSWYRLRSTLRSRLSSYVSLVLLIGLTGGVAMAAITAGRRTQSSYPAFLRTTNPSQLVVSVYGPTGQAVTDIGSAIARLPGVRRVRTVVAVTAFPIAPDGSPMGASANSSALASADGEFIDQDRLAVVSGRLADPSRPDEVVVDASAARLAGVRVGRTVPFGFYAPSQMALPGFGTAAVPPSYRVDARVVGIVKANNQLVQDDVDKAYGLVYLTEAFLRHTVSLAPEEASPEGYAVQLTDGARSATAAEAAIRKLIPSGAVYQFHLLSRAVTNVELAVRPESLAVGGFGAIAAVVTLLIGVQIIARQVRNDDTDREVLRALGAGVAVRSADSACGLVLAVVLGAAAALGVAFALSPVTTLGPIRHYGPAGARLDWAVDGTGLGVLVVVLGGTALVLSRLRATRREATGEQARPLSVVTAVQASRLPVSGQIGVRLALDPGRGRASVPVRTILLSGVVAVTLVVTTVVFGTSLRTLVSHPPLFGWDWSYVLDPTNGMPAETMAALDGDPDIVGWSGVDYNNLEIDGVEVPVLMSRPGGRGAVAPPILSGHSVQASNQIVIGSSTLAELHKRVGDTVLVSYGSPGDEVSVPPTPLRVVGTATFPAVGFESLISDHTSMGTGAMFSESSLPDAFRQAAFSNPDPNLEGPELVLIRVRPGLSRAAARADMRRLADAADKLYTSDPNATGNSVTVLGVQRPAQIVDYRTIGAAPLTLAIGLAAGALAALGLTLMSSVRRRRRDLAVLRTLGLTRRQLAAIVAWEATVSALVAVLVGVPLGIAAGREAWAIFARSLNVVPEPTVPLLSMLAVAVGAIFFANLVAAAPARAAVRVPAASLLTGA